MNESSLPGEVHGQPLAVLCETEIAEVHLDRRGQALHRHATEAVVTAQTHRKEMFYLTTHSIHFIYGYVASERERDFVFIITTHSTLFIYGYMASEREREKCFI